MSTEPETETSFAVILDEEEIPPRIYLVHNEADPIVDGKKGKPEGIGLPGGGVEPGTDKTPRHAARREVRREAGFWSVLATFGKGSQYGEVLCDPKPWVNNTIYVFHLKRINKKGGPIEETSETGRDMRATLGNILMMPLAVNKEKTVYNSQGIYYKHRERLTQVLEALGYDFCKLIPNLSELICKINRHEVGDYVHDTLCGALQAAGYNVTINGNFAVVSKPSWQRPTEEELETSYRDYALIISSKEDEAERRRWADG